MESSKKVLPQEGEEGTSVLKENSEEQTPFTKGRDLSEELSLFPKSVGSFPGKAPPISK